MLTKLLEEKEMRTGVVVKCLDHATIAATRGWGMLFPHDGWDSRKPVPTLLLAHSL